MTMASEYRAVFHQEIVRVAIEDDGSDEGGRGGGCGDDDDDDDDDDHADTCGSSSVGKSCEKGVGAGATARPSTLLLVTGEVELIFVDPASGSPGKFPPVLLERLGTR